MGSTNAGRLISFDGSDNKIQIGCNIHQLPQLVNVKFSAKSCRGGGLFRAGASAIYSGSHFTNAELFLADKKESTPL